MACRSEQNWINRSGSENFARLTDYQDDFQPGARRFDVGQRTNFTLTPMAIAALTQILDWQVARIATTLQAITDRIEQWARGHDLTHSRPATADRTCSKSASRPKQSLASPNSSPKATSSSASAAPPGVRISPHLYTTDHDVQRLFDALTLALNM